MSTINNRRHRRRGVVRRTRPRRRARRRQSRRTPRARRPHRTDPYRNQPIERKLTSPEGATLLCGGGSRPGCVEDVNYIVLRLNCMVVCYFLLPIRWINSKVNPISPGVVSGALNLEVIKNHKRGHFIGNSGRRPEFPIIFSAPRT